MSEDTKPPTFLIPAVKIKEIVAYRGMCTICPIEGTEIAIISGSVEALAAACRRLSPEMEFNPKITQQVVVMSAKEPIFNQ